MMSDEYQEGYEAGQNAVKADIDSMERSYAEERDGINSELGTCLAENDALSTRISELERVNSRYFDLISSCQEEATIAKVNAAVMRKALEDCIKAQDEDIYLICTKALSSDAGKELLAVVEAARECTNAASVEWFVKNTEWEGPMLSLKRAIDALDNKESECPGDGCSGCSVCLSPGDAAEIDRIEREEK